MLVCNDLVAQARSRLDSFLKNHDANAREGAF